MCGGRDLSLLGSRDGQPLPGEGVLIEAFQFC